MNEQDKIEYELVFIIQPDLDEDGINVLDTRLVDTITNQGGEIVATEMWGRRDLAYAIKRFTAGYYILHRFQMPSTGAEEVERTLRLSEDVIRFLLMKADR